MAPNPDPTADWDRQTAAHQAIMLHVQDDVATAVADLDAGHPVRVLDADGSIVAIEVVTGIPFGHKFALHQITAGQHVQKHGESIGVAAGDIARGEHVHTHNVESRRGRGDVPAPAPGDEASR